MNWNWYLFSFEGRINRAKLWLALLVVFCWMIALGLLAVAANAIFGGARSFHFSIANVFLVFDPAAYRAWSRTDIIPLLINAIATPLFCWVYFATSIKRLHDRDKGGWWIIPFFVLPALYDEIAERFEVPFAAALGLVAFALCIWGFVEMYCLKGSPKTNRYGPNPLQPVDVKPRWDQAREIEMVPHKAGPPPVWRVKRGA